MSYIELHSRSAFSFLRGASTPEQLAQRAAHLQMPAMALCDRDGVYGAPWFFTKARELGIRPIVGAELTMEDNSIIPILVKSRTGYKNLCQLLTAAHLQNEKGKCKVRWEEVPAFAEGLVALTGDASGPLVKALNSRRQQGGREAESMARLVNIFGRDSVFVEIQRHRIRGEERLNKTIIEVARRFHLPLLATNGVIYSSDVERPILDVFTCIRNHTHLDAAGTLLEQNCERYLKSADQMR